MKYIIWSVFFHPKNLPFGGFSMRKSNLQCNHSGCKSQDFSVLLFCGKVLCKSHYSELFLTELKGLFKIWDGKTKPPNRLKYLIGRYYSEHEVALIGKPSLSKNIVHNQSIDWFKTNDSVIFTSIRYPENKKYGYPSCHVLLQKWNFSIDTLKFTFISEKKVA